MKRDKKSVVAICIVGIMLNIALGSECAKGQTGAPFSPRYELKPLAGTKWRVISRKPQKVFKSIVSDFRWDGTVVTIKTYMNGSVETVTQSYRIVGSTLIISSPGYMENPNFKMDRNRLTVYYKMGTVVMHRVG